MYNLLKIIATAILFFVIDLVWIAYLAKDAYSVQILQVQKSPMVLNPTLVPLVYLLIGTGIVYLVEPKLAGLEKNSRDYFYNAMLWGGLLGMVSYGVFDLTNYAIFSDWNPVLALGDVFWGTFLTGFTTYLSGLFF